MWGRLTRSLVMQVGAEGVVIVPGSGTLKVTDRTLDDVRSELLGRLKSLFQGVNIDLRLASPRTFTIFLTGQFKAPGPAVVTGTNRAMDVLARDVLAGGAARRRIEVRHPDGTQEIADLELFLRNGDAALNPWLRDGDVIYAPIATSFVDAHGALVNAGRFELGPGDSLLTLLRLAGGMVPGADSSRALFLRWRDQTTPESLWIDVEDVYARRFNPPLRADDRLYVYFQAGYHVQHEAMIFGEVSRPGPYPITEGRDRISDLIEAAGGFLKTADLASIRVHRGNLRAAAQDPDFDRLLRLSRDQLTNSEYQRLRTKLAGLREEYLVDWKRVQSDPQRLDLLLRDGDLVNVDRLVSAIRVDGEVRLPGFMNYESGLSVRDYIKQAGGFTDRSWNRRIQVTRATGQTLPARNVRIVNPGDFVWVPERPDKTVWDYARETLTTLTQAAAVIVVIRALD
jgi:protein involved in polysaccharide export with SLBB domain